MIEANGGGAITVQDIDFLEIKYSKWCSSFYGSRCGCGSRVSCLPGSREGPYASKVFYTKKQRSRSLPCYNKYCIYTEKLKNCFTSLCDCCLQQTASLVRNLVTWSSLFFHKVFRRGRSSPRTSRYMSVGRPTCSNIPMHASYVLCTKWYTYYICCHASNNC